MKQASLQHVSDVGLTRRLAENAVSYRYDDLPDNVVQIAKQCLLDWFAVTLAGSREPLTRILFEEVSEEGGNPHATLVGFGQKTSVRQAALVNGSASHALDYDDVVEALRGHPTVPVYSPLLALAEKRRASGEALLAAFVAGFETECRVGDYMGDTHYESGWHATGTSGVFGAAAACANLLGLDAEATARAFGIAGTQAAGLKSMFGTMCKPLHAGKAAANGLLAADLAAKGFTSRDDVIEAPQGFGDTQSKAPSAEDALDGLGSRFHTPGVLFKYHAACFGTHATIEASRALKEAHDFKPADIDRIELLIPVRNLTVCNIADPTTGLEGKFSLRMTCAMALSGVDTSDLATFTDEKVQEPELQELTQKVSVVGDQAYERATGEVVIHLKDGVVLREKGDVSVPATDLDAQWSKLETKFRAISTPVIGAENAGRLVEAVAAIERADNLDGVMRLCAPQ